MSCERRTITIGDECVVKFSCSDCKKGASVEKSRDCMRSVIEALIENPSIDVIVLSGVYEHEYSGSGLQALKEISEIVRESRYWSLARVTPEDCKRCAASRSWRLRRILKELSSDPASGLGKLQDFHRETLSRVRRGARKCKACRSAFINDTLEPLKTSLENSALLKNRGDYASVLQPLVRPCFMSSRLKMEPPPGCEIVDAYEVGESEVRIYRLPDRLQNLYFLFPRGYDLPHDRVQLLQRTRQLMLEHAPALDPNPLRAREQVRRLGEDLMARLVVEGRLGITRREVASLAEHLAKFTAGLGLIETLLADPRIEDIYADAPIGRTAVHVRHRDYDECLTNILLSPDEAESLASRFRAISGRPFSEADPVLDLNLKDVRVAVVGHPLSPAGMALALRRHKPTPWTLPQFIRVRFLTPYAAGLLSLLVDAQSCILVTGSRGAGKTSLLGGLMLEVLPRFRIITIEDTREILVEHLIELGFKVQSLQVQSVISGTDAELSAEEALRAALRLGESVLIVGEVRGEEARTLYEAMRVGAAGNSVMGTIHGATARDVFERVVHDLRIPPNSFKATDAILVAAPIRPRGRIARMRRLVQITEVRKGWRRDPVEEGGFENLMYYDRSADELRPTRALRSSKSELIISVARKWGVRPSEVNQNIELRARIYGALVETASELQRPDLLEADFVVRSNLKWHGLMEEQLGRGRISYSRIFRGWRDWLLSVVR